jgi:HAD superfamily hydrolase (TIGR01459 family)
MPAPIVQGIADVTRGREVWLCDIWGVMHNGVAAFPSAVDAMQRHRRGGGTVILVSNAPRPARFVAEQLARLGVPADAFDAILTSGDVTVAMLASWQRRPLWHVGPERDRGLFKGLDIKFALAEDAEVVLCSGLFDDTRETPDDYRDRFRPLAAREVPMICANPDLKVERGGEIIWCAGGLGQLYETMGGRVDYAGKPYPAVYTRALELAASLRGRAVTHADCLAIGDGLNTDIRGAHEAGIASVFIPSAIHMEGALAAEALDRLFAGTPYRPLAALPQLAW